jgi:hypothetical protein
MFVFFLFCDVKSDVASSFVPGGCYTLLFIPELKAKEELSIYIL